MCINLPILLHIPISLPIIYIPLNLPINMNQREIRGKQIAEKNNQIIRIDESHYKVNSQSRKLQHDVISLEYGWSCSCEDHYFNKICCKHIHAV